MKQFKLGAARMDMAKDWNEEAITLWEAGEQEDAITLLKRLAFRSNGRTARPLLQQLGIYLWQVRDYATARDLFYRDLFYYKDDPAFIHTLALNLHYLGEHRRSYDLVSTLLDKVPNDPAIYDLLATVCYELKQEKRASEYGTRALILKDRACRNKPVPFSTSQSVSDVLSNKNLKNVISFSLFGNGKRYLRGAIDNAHIQKALYPDWGIRFYLDSSVPEELVKVLRDLECEIIKEPDEQTLLQKLSWRFKVANDPSVGRFLVRDVDSVINIREKEAVDRWIESDRLFHIMRDWWTHTDLVLAGLWGGIANVLPSMEESLAAYATGQILTKNSDQDFLRDRIWPYIRECCLVHDRCFTPEGAVKWPSEPQDNDHVGSNAYGMDNAGQIKRLAQWHSLSCLGIKTVKKTITISR